MYHRILFHASKKHRSLLFLSSLCLLLFVILVHDLTQTDQVTVQVQRFVDVIGNETLSAKELLERLELKHRPTFMKTYVRPALELGLLEMTVPDKPRSNKQKYRAIKKMMHSVFVFFGRYLQGIDNM